MCSGSCASIVRTGGNHDEAGSICDIRSYDVLQKFSVELGCNLICYGKM